MDRSKCARLNVAERQFAKALGGNVGLETFQPKAIGKSASSTSLYLLDSSQAGGGAQPQLAGVNPMSITETSPKQPAACGF